MNNNVLRLIEAQNKAADLFLEIENRNLIFAGKSEKQLNTEIFELAYELFGIKKYWHKRIIRAGKNTLEPYNENPIDLIIQKDDILFIDFGPIFDEWEADYGRTYVVGNDPLKHKLKNDIELAWEDCKVYYESNKEMTGAKLYQYAVELAKKYGWEFGGDIAGHIIGHFPHESLEKEDKTNYIHPENNLSMGHKNKSGTQKEWILEIHFVNTQLKIGGFFEQLINT
jgi:Xaa-Pro aminopeptidase